MTRSIPDIVAIVKASRDGKINVRREVRDALGVKDGPLYLEVAEEVLLTPRKSAAARRVEMQRSRLCLPDDVVQKLKLETGSQSRSGMAACTGRSGRQPRDVPSVRRAGGLAGKVHPRGPTVPRPEAKGRGARGSRSPLDQPALRSPNPLAQRPCLGRADTSRLREAPPRPGRDQEHGHHRLVRVRGPIGRRSLA